jgi:putative serine protease PepD
MRGVLWSHLLASVLGGVVVAGVLLAFGVVGTRHTETVPINYATTPPVNPAGPTAGSAVALTYLTESPGVVQVRAVVGRRVTSPFIAGTERPGTVATGSGVLISRRGYIITAFHVIEGALAADRITVSFNTDTVRRAEVIEYSQPNDVALLRVSMRGVSRRIRPLPVGNSRSVRVGDAIVTLANPYGLERTVASGIVASLQPELAGADGGGIADVIETDVSPAPGAAGGPLLDGNGNVIGIESFLEVSDGSGRFPVSFAVPINTVRTIIPRGVLP